MQDKDVPTQGSAVVPAYDTLKGSMAALRARIAVLVDYLDAVETGKDTANLEACLSDYRELIVRDDARVRGARSLALLCHFTLHRGSQPRRGLGKRGHISCLSRNCG